MVDVNLFLTVVVFFIVVGNGFMLLIKKFQDFCIRPLWIGPLVMVIVVETIASVFLLGLASSSKDVFTTRNKGMAKTLNFQVLN